MYKIRKATVQDVEQLNGLINSAYRGDSSRKGWTTEADLLDGTRITPELLENLLQKDNTHLYVYEDGDQILGCVELRKESSKLYLGMLTVNPLGQGKGIGKILLNESEKVAKELKCTSIYMSVISKRDELIDWYKRSGYRETGERKPFQMPDERWGIPKTDLEFIFLEKLI